MLTPGVSKVSLLLLALGGCSTSLAECLQNFGELSTQGQVALPQGCSVNGTPSADLRTLECNDGRQGFLFD